MQSRVPTRTSGRAHNYFAALVEPALVVARTVTFCHSPGIVGAARRYSERSIELSSLFFFEMPSVALRGRASW